jgi:hypothetical protein
MDMDYWHMVNHIFAQACKNLALVKAGVNTYGDHKEVAELGDLVENISGAKPEELLQLAAEIEEGKFL